MMLVSVFLAAEPSGLMKSLTGTQMEGGWELARAWTPSPPAYQVV